MPGTKNRKSSQLTVKDWVTAVTVVQQDKLIDFVIRAYGGLLIVTVLIIFLQGFKLWGFSLDATYLKWLGAATIGEIGGLLMLTFKAVFGRR